MAKNELKKEVLAIIPARGGSKSIPRKNIIDVAGKPLIAWTIEAALKSRDITRVIVSSDDEEILAVSKKYGAEPIKRPSELAADNSTSEPVILHALDYLLEKEKYSPELVVYLQPTSPLRTAEDIDRAFSHFMEQKAEALISVYEIDKSFLKSFLIDEKGFLKGVSNNEFPFMNRQTLPGVYMPNGAIYIVRAKNFKKSRKFFEKKTAPFIMAKERSVDLDDKEDLELIRRLLEKI